MILLLVGFLLGLSVAPLRAWWTARQQPTPQLAQQPARYVITSHGVVVWSGDDGTQARDRWAAIDAGTFHDAGTLRGSR